VRLLSAALLGVLTIAACARLPRGVPRFTAPVMRAHAILPNPESVEIALGAAPFRITADTAIDVPDDERVLAIGRFLSEWIGLAAAAAPPRVEVVRAGATHAGHIALTLGAVATAEEGYELTAAADRVVIAAREPAGLFYGVQTLRQLLPPFVEFGGVRPDPSRPVHAPAAHVVDRPRFAWRGAMLDVARHFFRVEDVKRYVDLMALYKLNRLHLHLADDQGWRIEIASWPNLARHGGSTQVGGGPGGFYTQAQYAELVAYAASRFITIVPEIDMPGHTNAALASYPALNCSGQAPPLYTDTNVGFSALCIERDVTYQFVDDVVREIAAMTPGPYFHIGGDEVKTLGADAYNAFVERVQSIVASHGKQMIGWDEIAGARLQPTAIVQHWRPKASPAGAVARGVKVIVSSANRLYIDMKYDSHTPLGLNWAGTIDARDAYDWDPVAMYTDVPESAMLGIEAPLWSETVTTIRDVELLAFPRLAEIAEVAWSPAKRRAWDEFKGRLAAHAPRWTALGVNFYRSPQVEWER
jgi:hexosaminidase